LGAGLPADNHGDGSASDWRQYLSTHPPVREHIERLVAAERRFQVSKRHDPR